MKTSKPQVKSHTKVWSLMTLGFAALVFAALASDFDPSPAFAQDAPKAKTKTAKKAEYAPKSKNLPVAKSLTNGQKIDSAALAKLIDQEIGKRLKAEKSTAAGLCTDEEFIRRVYLDLVGVIPTADKVTTFLSSKDPQKRAKLIDELLADPRFGKSLAETWVLQLIPRDINNQLLKRQAFEDWLAEHFNKGTPLNKVVSELVTATGAIDKNPAATYFVANPTVDKMTDNVTRMFLGVQLQCAQCHNHPFTDWKQTEYWAMASFFMKTRIQGSAKGAAKGGAAPSVAETNAAAKGKKGGLPESAKIVPAKFLQGDQPKLNTSEPYRPVLATWMTSTDNKFFARAMINRFWHQLFGRGIVNPVDDMHDDNAASHPELLATLTEQFKLHNFDVKFLVRTICNSEVYQRSSVSKEDAAQIDPELYIRRELRVLSPEQLYDSLAAVLGNAKPTDAPKGPAPKKGGPVTPRANFLTFFRVDDFNAMEYQNGIPQALRLMNSPFTNRAEAIAADITKNTKTPAEAVERLYLTAYARRPSAKESERYVTYVNRPGSTPRVAYGDILWALLNSSEFVHNH